MTWRPANPDDGAPRRVDDSLGQVVRALGRSAPVLVVLCREWDALVGPTLAGHCRPVRVEGGVLTIAVDQPAWATELRYLATEVIARANQAVGESRLQSVRVVVRPR